MSHTMKLWEGMTEARLREITRIAENQFGFRAGNSTTLSSALRMIRRNILRKNKELHVDFVELEKAYDRVPRELIIYDGAYARK